MERASLWHKIWDTVWTTFVVSLITAFVWLYAEAESVKSQSVEFDIQFVAPAGRTMLIQTEGRQPQPQHVSAHFRCANSVLAEFVRRNNSPIPIEVQETPETQVVVLKDALASNAAFAKLGINIIETQPERVQITAKKLEPVTLPIKFESAGLLLGPVLTIDPPQATIMTPIDLVGSLTGQKIDAIVDPAQLAKLELNQPHTVEAQLKLPDFAKLAGASISPLTTKVTLTILKETKSLSLQSVPVLVTLQADETAHFTVTLDENQRVLRDLVLTGPSDAIELLRKNPESVYASIRLTTEDLEKASKKDDASSFAPMIYNIPPTVTFSPPPAVRLKIVKREQ